MQKTKSNQIIILMIVVAMGILVFAIMPNKVVFAEEGKPIPKPTPDPTIESIYATQVAQDAQIRTLLKELEYINREVDLVKEESKIFTKKELLENLEPIKTYGIIFTAIFLLFTVIGINTYRDMRSYFNEKAREMLEKELYRLDATFIPIYIPSAGFEKEQERIKITGLKNIRKYDILGKNTLKGVVILCVGSEEEEKLFLDFINEYKPNPIEVAYIL